MEEYARKLFFGKNIEEQNEEMQLDYKTKLEQIKSNLMKKIIEDLRKNESITIEHYWYWLDFETRIFADANDIVKSKLDIEKNWFSIKSKAERFYKEELKEKQRKELEELQKIQQAELEKQIEQQKIEQEKKEKKDQIISFIGLIGASVFIVGFLKIIFYLEEHPKLMISILGWGLLLFTFVLPPIMKIISFFVRWHLFDDK